MKIHTEAWRTHTSWRYTQKHAADIYPPIIKIHTEAQCRHIQAHHKDTQLTCKSTTQTHTHPSWRHATYMQKYNTNIHTHQHGHTSYTQKHNADTRAWDVRDTGPTHDCQHQFLSLWILWDILALLKTVNTNFWLWGYCERYWPYTWLSTAMSLWIFWEILALHIWLSTPISFSVDIVRDIGPTHDCQHRLLSLWILSVNTDFCLCGYCERYWPYTWLSTLIPVSMDTVVHCDEFPVKNDQNKFHIQPCTNQPEWKQAITQHCKFSQSSGQQVWKSEASNPFCL